MEWVSFANRHTVDDVKQATHLSMIGGKYAFPNKKLFHVMYLTHLKDAASYCLMERVHYPCRLFMDVDSYKDSIESIFDDILEHFGECLISSNQECGYHFIFPQITIFSKEDAKQRINTFKESKIYDFIDTSVYATGLRMMGAHKSRTIQRVYTPLRWLANDSSTITKSFYLNETWLRFGSIHLPNDSAIENHGKTTHPIGIKSFINHSSNSESHVDFSCVHPNFKNVRVYKTTQHHRYIQVYTYEKYCINVRRHHTNQHVYFMVDCQQKTITQRCFSCKNECRLFKSTNVRIPLIVFYKLMV